MDERPTCPYIEIRNKGTPDAVEYCLITNQVCLKECMRGLKRCPKCGDFSVDYDHVLKQWKCLWKDCNFQQAGVEFQG